MPADQPRSPARRSDAERNRDKILNVARTALDDSGGEVSMAEISRRVNAILDSVEHEAALLREQARSDAADCLEDARRRADSLVAERRQRIADLSDELVAKSEAVISRLDDAEPVRNGFENLVRALGDAAERLALEAQLGEPVG